MSDQLAFSELFAVPKTVRLTPQQSDWQQEQNRRQNAKQRIYERLTHGPATGPELAAICLRYGARLDDLKRQGVRWTKEPIGGGQFRYRLHGAD